MRAREAKLGLLQIIITGCFGICAPSKTSAPSCVFLPLYAISSSSVRSSRASVVASLWRSLLSRESVTMGPQHLHRLLFASLYFPLYRIIRRRLTAYTRGCSLYCASRCSTRIIVPLTRHTLIIAINGTPTSRRTETHPGKPGAQTSLPFLRGVWVPRINLICSKHEVSEKN